MFYLELLDSYFPSNVFSYKDLSPSFLHDFPFGLAEQMIVPKKISYPRTRTKRTQKYRTNLNRKSVLPNLD